MRLKRSIHLGILSLGMLYIGACSGQQQTQDDELEVSEDYEQGELGQDDAAEGNGQENFVEESDQQENYNYEDNEENYNSASQNSDTVKKVSCLEIDL